MKKLAELIAAEEDEEIDEDIDEKDEVKKTVRTGYNLGLFTTGIRYFLPPKTIPPFLVCKTPPIVLYAEFMLIKERTCLCYHN